jgi:hypothetical protein
MSTRDAEIGTWLDADEAPIGYADAEFDEEPTGSSTGARSAAVLGYAEMLAEHSAAGAQGKSTPEFEPGSLPLASARATQQCGVGTSSTSSEGGCEPVKRGAPTYKLSS